MTTVHGPVVGRRRLRTALRRCREDAQLTQEQVAHAMEWSLSKLIRIENGDVSVSINDVKAMLQLYGVTDAPTVNELIETARIARRRTWWGQYKDDVPSPYASYIGLETETTALHYYHPLGVPGLLQTPGYATAVVRATAKFQLEPQDVETRVTIRMARQREVLGREDPPKVAVILDEGALRRVTGGVEVMREQLHHLVKSAESSNITMRVLPLSAGDNGVMGPFIILEFQDQADVVVYVESALVEYVLDRPDHAELYRRAYERMLQLCLGADESLELIKKIAGEL